MAPLPSWNDTAARERILAFRPIGQPPGSADFVPVEFIDDAGKPVDVQHRIGRRPIAVFDNSDGDLQMLQCTAAGDGARWCLSLIPGDR